MQVLSVSALRIEALKVIRFRRFRDARGYFAETFRTGIVEGREDLAFLRDVPFVQNNESLSRAGTVRGLHFQWNPHMGKLVRTVSGRMVDVMLDIRIGSPSFGKALMYDMPAGDDADFGEWLWVPPGFAHGNFFTETTRIEYRCTGEYSPQTEAGISPLSPDIDWSSCDPALKDLFDRIVAAGPLISDKDAAAPSLGDWARDDRARNFPFGEL